MSQARRTRRTTQFANRKPITHGLREILFIFFCFMALYLLVSLITYYPGDPGISYTGQVEEVRNKGGVAGALFADIFFYLFGYFAYLFPVMVGYIGWLIYQGKHHDMLAEPRHLVIPGVGFVMTLSAGCGLAIVHFASEGVLLPSHAGGILGMLVGKSLQGVFSQLGATLLLLALFFTGITLLTGLSWLKLMDTLGFHTLKWMPVVQEFMLRHFWPWLLRSSKRGLHKTQELSKNALQRVKHGSQAAWHAWEERRAEWRKEREQYDDYYYDDEYDEYDDDDDYYEYEDDRKQQAHHQSSPRSAQTEVRDVRDVREDKQERDVKEDKREDKQESPGVSTESPAPVSSSSSAVMPTQTETQDRVKVEDSEAVESVSSATELPGSSDAPILPDIDFLAPVPKAAKYDVDSLTHWMVNSLKSLQVDAKVKEVHPGPVLTGFEVEPITHINVNHLDELAIALGKVMKVKQVKVVETVPGILGIELANPQRHSVYLREVLQANDYRNAQALLTIALGKNITGQPVIADLTRVPHILIAGSSAEEKITALNVLILSLIYKSSPTFLRFILVDNQVRDFAPYDDLPHLLTPVVTDLQTVPPILKWCVQEMERRYRLMAKLGVRNIENYNQAITNPEEFRFIENLREEPPVILPYVIVIIHEIGELMKTSIGLAAEESITLLTQKARAAGIHIILATHEPSVSVITGLIKANIPTRIAFQVRNKSESRTILGQMGAETLLGKGDMLYMTAGTGMPMRVHGCQVSVQEVENVSDQLKAQAKPQYISLKLQE